jgi:hypothetical protein
MRFFPKSSLDQIESPEPFVHATNWDQFRWDIHCEVPSASDFPRLNSEVDACFEQDPSFYLVDMQEECSAGDFMSCGGDSMDLELGLLEAVQDIALCMAKTQVRRTLSEPSSLHPQ